MKRLMLVLLLALPLVLMAGVPPPPFGMSGAYIKNFPGDSAGFFFVETLWVTPTGIYFNSSVSERLDSTLLSQIINSVGRRFSDTTIAGLRVQDPAGNINDNYLIKYNLGSGLLEWEADISGGTPTYNSISDPDGFTSIDFGVFTNTHTSSADGWGGLTLSNTVASMTSQDWLLSLFYTDSGSVNADYIRCVDDLTNHIFTVQEDGDVFTTGALQAKGVITLGDADLIYPAADGANGEVMTTDGAGNLSFSTAGAGTVTDGILGDSLSKYLPLSPAFADSLLDDVDFSGHNAEDIGTATVLSGGYRSQSGHDLNIQPGNVNDNLDLTGSVGGDIRIYESGSLRWTFQSDSLKGESGTVLSGLSYLGLAPIAGGGSHLAGRLFYDDDNECPAFFNDEADITLQIGQESWIRVRNVSGASITDGQVVYIDSASGNLPTIELADADTADYCQVVGFATHTIENNSIGYVTTNGLVRGVNTSTYNEGDVLYIDTIKGGFTTTQYLSPICRVSIGHVTQSDVSGDILVRIDKLRQLSSLNDVDTTGLTTGDALIWNGTVWLDTGIALSGDTNNWNSAYTHVSSDG